MLAFADGAADVLVCTTIIESGLDIPNANTIFIDHADTLGLAQLHQLRGRVGPVEPARLRLPALPAPRAAERRGAQAARRRSSTRRSWAPGSRSRCATWRSAAPATSSAPSSRGHIAAVGFDLYSRLLAEAVEEAEGAAARTGPPVVDAPQAVVDLPRRRAPARRRTCPRRRRSWSCTGGSPGPARAGDLAAFRQEVTDRFGPMPAPVLRLVEVAELRLAAEAAGVASLSREEGWLVVRFGAGALARDRDALLAPAGSAARCRASGRAT